MGKWIDVKESDWFYSEIEEASRIILEDGQPFVSGIPYNNFVQDAPYVYKEIIATNGQTVFTINQSVTPTGDNPLFVYVDGVQTLYKSVTKNDSGGTDIELYTAPHEGSVVSICSYGIPQVDRFGKPSIGALPKYPRHQLDHTPYYYDKFSRYTQEYVYVFGKALKRAQIDDDEWAKSSDWEAIVQKYIGYSTDVYVIDPNGVLYLPYNLNDVTFTITYQYIKLGLVNIDGKEFEPVKITEDGVSYLGIRSVAESFGYSVNYNSTNGIITLSNGAVIYPSQYTIDGTGTAIMPSRLLASILNKSISWDTEHGVVKTTTGTSTAHSDSVVYINRFFPNALINRAEAITLVDRLRQHFYSRFTDLEAPSNNYYEAQTAYEGQQVFRLNCTYQPGSGLLQVKVDGVLKRVNTDYKEFDSHTVLFNEPLSKDSLVEFSYSKNLSSRFSDVGVDRTMKVVGTTETHPLNGSSAWWKDTVLALEDETLNDGTYLISGYGEISLDTDGTVLVDGMYSPLQDTSSNITMFLAESPITRAETVTFLNRFRKWCIERFKI